MECGTHYTFDFCDKPACVGAVVNSRDDIESPHLPSHDFVKIRTDIHHYREIGKVLRSAESGLERAQKLLERASQSSGQDEESSESDETTTQPETKLVRRDTAGSSDAESEVDVPILNCISCSQSIEQPCWYCIDCPGM